MSKLLSRDEFKELVFKRTKGKCIFCEKNAVDAHHILDRKLFLDGGYYLSNGAAVCEEHHWACERTDITVEEVRKAANITEYVLPAGFSTNLIFDKWGNILNSDGTIQKGPLFEDDGCKKILKHKFYLFL